jgi:hypothetical protein
MRSFVLVVDQKSREQIKGFQGLNRRVGNPYIGLATGQRKRTRVDHLRESRLLAK